MVAPTQQFLHKLLPILGVSPLLKNHVQTSDVEGEGVKTEVGKKFSDPGRVDERIDFNSVDKIQPVRRSLTLLREKNSFSQLRS